MEDILGIKLTQGDLLFHNDSNGEFLKAYLAEFDNQDKDGPRKLIHERNLEEKRLAELKQKQATDIT